MGFSFKYNSADKLDFTPRELMEEMAKREDILLLDVREPLEVQICSLENAMHVPMGQIPSKIAELPKNKDLFVFCHMGVRSKQVMQYLRKIGFTRAFNLAGGIDRWSIEVDSKVQRY